MPNQIRSKAQNALIHAAAEGRSSRMSAKTAKKMLRDNHPKVSRFPERVSRRNRRR